MINLNQLIQKQSPLLFSLISTMRAINQNSKHNNNECDRTLEETTGSMHYEEDSDNDYSGEGFVPHVLKL
jgi:hypothetical protein